MESEGFPTTAAVGRARLAALESGGKAAPSSPVALDSEREVAASALADVAAFAAASAAGAVDSAAVDGIFVPRNRRPAPPPIRGRGDAGDDAGATVGSASSLADRLAAANAALMGAERAAAAQRLKLAGDEAMRSGEAAEAAEHWRAALAVGLPSAAERAGARNNLSLVAARAASAAVGAAAARPLWAEAEDEASLALLELPGWAKAHKRRALAREGGGRWAEAAEDWAAGGDSARAAAAAARAPATRGGAKQMMVDDDDEDEGAIVGGAVDGMATVLDPAAETTEPTTTTMAPVAKSTSAPVTTAAVTTPSPPSPLEAARGALASGDVAAALILAGEALEAADGPASVAAALTLCAELRLAGPDADAAAAERDACAAAAASSGDPAGAAAAWRLVGRARAALAAGGPGARGLGATARAALWGAAAAAWRRAAGLDEANAAAGPEARRCETEEARLTLAVADAAASREGDRAASEARAEAARRDAVAADAARRERERNAARRAAQTAATASIYKTRKGRGQVVIEEEPMAEDEKTMGDREAAGMMGDDDLPPLAGVGDTAAAAVSAARTAAEAEARSRAKRACCKAAEARAAEGDLAGARVAATLLSALQARRAGAARAAEGEAASAACVLANAEAEADAAAAKANARATGAAEEIAGAVPSASAAEGTGNDVNTVFASLKDAGTVRFKAGDWWGGVDGWTDAVRCAEAAPAGTVPAHEIAACRSNLALAHLKLNRPAAARDEAAAALAVLGKMGTGNDPHAQLRARIVHRARQAADQIAADEDGDAPEAPTTVPVQQASPQAGTTPVSKPAITTPADAAPPKVVKAAPVWRPITVQCSSSEDEEESAVPAVAPAVAPAPTVAPAPETVVPAPPAAPALASAVPFPSSLASAPAAHAAPAPAREAALDRVARAAEAAARAAEAAAAASTHLPPPEAPKNAHDVERAVRAFGRPGDADADAALGAWAARHLPWRAGAGAGADLPGLFGAALSAGGVRACAAAAALGGEGGKPLPAADAAAVLDGLVACQRFSLTARLLPAAVKDLLRRAAEAGSGGGGQFAAALAPLKL